MGDRPELLGGGRSTEGVARIGGMVHRPMSERAVFVHELLAHFEVVGFAGAPRFRGVDGEGREMLTFVEGEVAHGGEPGEWTDEQLRRVAGLLRGLHDATVGSDLAGEEEVVCHNDFAPWNTVFVGGLPVAVIDFDDAGPGSRIRDLSYVVWCWLGLGSARVGVGEQARRIGLMCGAYGCGVDGIVPEIAERQREIHGKHVRNGWVEQAGRVADEIEWLRVHGGELARRLDQGAG